MVRLTATPVCALTTVGLAIASYLRSISCTVVMSAFATEQKYPREACTQHCRACGPIQLVARVTLIHWHLCRRANQFIDLVKL